MDQRVAESNGKKSHQLLWVFEAVEQFHNSHVFLETHLLQVSLTTGNFKHYFRSSEILKDICPTSVKIHIFKNLQ